MGKKLITFSLWGDDPKYCVGAVRNAELALRLYPEWACRFYMGASVPSSVVEELQKLTTRWGRYTQMPDGIMAGICGGSLEPDLIQIYHMKESGDWRGMFWRFYPASEDDVEAFISRDCDSRLNAREAAAVEQWMKNPHLIHVMRDHPHHTTPILGGMWGAKRHAIPDMVELIEQWNKEDRWQTDQDFLRNIIWPKYHYKAMVHDDWNRFPMPGTERRSFPTPRDGDNFVGAIIGPNEERLHPEHHAML